MEAAVLTETTVAQCPRKYLNAEFASGITEKHARLRKTEFNSVK
jgi:hypothetical protein